MSKDTMWKRELHREAENAEKALQAYWGELLSPYVEESARARVLLRLQPKEAEVLGPVRLLKGGKK